MKSAKFEIKYSNGMRSVEVSSVEAAKQEIRIRPGQPVYLSEWYTTTVDHGTVTVACSAYLSRADRDTDQDGTSARAVITQIPKK